MIREIEMLRALMSANPLRLARIGDPTSRGWPIRLRVLARGARIQFIARCLTAAPGKIKLINCVCDWLSRYTEALMRPAYGSQARRRNPPPSLSPKLGRAQAGSAEGFHLG